MNNQQSSQKTNDDFVQASIIGKSVSNKDNLVKEQKRRPVALVHKNANKSNPSLPKFNPQQQKSPLSTKYFYYNQNQNVEIAPFQGQIQQQSPILPNQSKQVYQNYYANVPAKISAPVATHDLSSKEQTRSAVYSISQDTSGFGGETINLVKLGSATQTPNDWNQNNSSYSNTNNDNSYQIKTPTIQGTAGGLQKPPLAGNINKDISDQIQRSSWDLNMNQEASQAQQQQQARKARQLEMQQRFESEQKKLRDYLMNFSESSVTTLHKENEELNNLMKEQKLNNEKQIDVLINNAINDRGLEAIRKINLQKIDEYSKTLEIQNQNPLSEKQLDQNQVILFNPFNKGKKKAEKNKYKNLLSKFDQIKSSSLDRARNLVSNAKSSKKFNPLGTLESNLISIDKAQMLSHKKNKNYLRNIYMTPPLPQRDTLINNTNENQDSNTLGYLGYKLPELPRLNVANKQGQLANESPKFKQYNENTQNKQNSDLINLGSIIGDKKQKNIVRDKNYMNVFLQPYTDGQINQDKDKDNHNPHQLNQNALSLSDNQQKELADQFYKELSSVCNQSPLQQYLRDLQKQSIDRYQTSPQNTLQQKQQPNEQIFSNGSKNIDQVVNSRFKTQLLNTVLEDILSGKYYYNSANMHQNIINKDIMNEVTSTKYLKGIDFKQMLVNSFKQNSGVAGKDKNAQNMMVSPNFLASNQMPVKRETLDDIFELTHIKQSEQKIHALLALQYNVRGVNKPHEEDVITFLTQVYQHDKTRRSKSQEDNQLYQDEILQTKDSIDVDDNDCDYMSIQKKKEDAKIAKKLQKQQEYEQKLAVINKQTSQKKSIIDKLLLGTQNSAKNVSLYSQKQILTHQENEKLGGRDQLLYMSFLELVRQMGTKCKEQALLLVKIWHSYFDQMEIQMSSILASVVAETSSINDNMKKLQSTIEQFILKQEESDNKFYDMKTNYAKTQHILDIAAKLMHEAEDKYKIEQQKNAQLLSDIQILLPHYDSYLRDNQLQIQLKRMSQSMVTKKLPTNLDHEFYQQNDETIDQFEEKILLDIDRLTSALQTKQQIAVYYEREHKKVLKLKLSNQELKRINGTQNEQIYELTAMYDKLNQKSTKDKTSHKKYYDTLQRKYDDLREKCTQMAPVMRKPVQSIVTQTELSMNETQKKQFITQSQTLSPLAKHSQPSSTSNGQKLATISISHNLNVNSSPGKNYHQKEAIKSPQLSSRKRGALATDKAKQVKQIVKNKDVVEALMNQPVAVSSNVFGPIRQIIKKVRGSGDLSDYVNKTKSIKKVLQLVYGVISSKIQFLDTQPDHRQSLLNMDRYFYEFMKQKYGFEQLVNKYCEIYLRAIDASSSEDMRVNIFSKMIGLDQEHLPYSIFLKFVQMIKMTNISLQVLFTTNIADLYLDYQIVINSYKETLGQNASDYIYTLAFMNLKSYCKIVSDNPLIDSNKAESKSQMFDLSLYNYYKDFLDKFSTTVTAKPDGFTGRIQQPQPINEAIENLFRQHKNEHNSPIMTKDQLISYAINTLKSKATQNNQPNGNAQKASQLKQYLKKMVQLFVFDFQENSSNEIIEAQLIKALKQKIEVKIPVSAYFHIGLNSVIENENNENQYYQQLFQFYSMVEIDELQIQLGNLVKKEYNYEGMEFNQLLLFKQDCKRSVQSQVNSSPKKQCGIKISDEQLREIYNDICESSSRQRIVCDDFIELTKKYQIISNRKVLEENKTQRENNIVDFMNRQNSYKKNSSKQLNLSKGKESLKNFSPQITQMFVYPTQKTSLDNINNITILSKQGNTNKQDKKLQHNAQQNINTSQQMNRLSSNNIQVFTDTELSKQNSLLVPIKSMISKLNDKMIVKISTKTLPKFNNKDLSHELNENFAQSGQNMMQAIQDKMKEIDNGRNDNLQSQQDTFSQVANKSQVIFTKISEDHLNPDHNEHQSILITDHNDENSMVSRNVVDRQITQNSKTIASNRDALIVNQNDSPMSGWNYSHNKESLVAAKESILQFVQTSENIKQKEQIDELQYQDPIVIVNEETKSNNQNNDNQQNSKMAQPHKSKTTLNSQNNDKLTELNAAQNVANNNATLSSQISQKLNQIFAPQNQKMKQIRLGIKNATNNSNDQNSHILPYEGEIISEKDSILEAASPSKKNLKFSFFGGNSVTIDQDMNLSSVSQSPEVSHLDDKQKNEDIQNDINN